MQSSLAQGAVAAAEAQKFETVARGRAAALQASPQPKPETLTPRLKRGKAAPPLAGGRAGSPRIAQTALDARPYDRGARRTAVRPVGAVQVEAKGIAEAGITRAKVGACLPTGQPTDGASGALRADSAADSAAYSAAYSAAPCVPLRTGEGHCFRAALQGAADAELIRADGSRKVTRQQR